MRKLNLLSLPSTKVTRWYISLEYYWLTTCILIIPGVYGEIMAYRKYDLQFLDSQTLWIKWILIKFAASGFLYFYLLFAKLLLLRIGFKGFNLLQFLIIVIPGGFLNGLLQHYLMRSLELVDPGTLFSRLTAPIPVSILVVAFLSTLTSTLRRYRIQNQLALDEIEILRNQKEAQKLILDGYSEAIFDLESKISDSTSEAISRIGAIAGLDDPMNSSISEQIRYISDTTIRSLSHQIESTYAALPKKADANSGLRTLNLIRILKESINFAPIAVLPVSFAISFISFGSLIRHATFLQSGFMSFGLFSIIFLINWLSSVFYRISGVQNIYTVILVFIATSLLPFVIERAQAIQHLIPDIEKYPPQFKPFVVATLLATVAGYVSQAGLLHSEDILKYQKQIITNTQISSQPVNKELVQISRSWARHLHGKVQSQILAGTFILEKAQHDGDSLAVQNALNLMVANLKDATNLERSSTQTLETAITERTGKWEGILEIEMLISPELKTSAGMGVLTVADIVEEMVTNASRHGAATKIRVEIQRRDPSHLVIRSIDNGDFFESEGKGFGLRFFEEVSDGRWDISRNAAFAETTVSLLFELPKSIYSLQHQTLAPQP